MKNLMMILAIVCGCTLSAAPTKLVFETVEAAAKVSGKTLGRSGRKAAVHALEHAVAKYGDDVLRSVKSGGLEALEQGAKHGADFWKFSKVASTPMKRALALRADDWMPHLKRVGPDFLKLEERAPGLGIPLIKEFGDDAVKILHKAPNEDLAKLYTCVSRTKDPAVKAKLFNTYKKGGSKFLKNLDSKKILAGGLSIAAITAAYTGGKGFGDSLLHIAKTSPEKLVEPFFTTLPLVILTMLFIFSTWFRKKIYQIIRETVILLRKIWRKRKTKANNA